MKLNIVTARTGIEWVRLGIRTFLKQPLALMALVFTYLSVAMVLSLVPVVGILIAWAIIPSATLGFMAATREITNGRVPTPLLFVSAFRAGRERLRAMLILGALYAAAMLAVMLLAGLIGAPLDGPMPQGAEKEPFKTIASALLTMGMLAVVNIVFWHAPALVHWHGISPVKSLFFSTVACVRNIRAFAVYALAWFGMTFALVLVLTMVLAATANPQIVTIAGAPMFLFMFVALSTSVYFTFRDSFLADEAPTELPAESPIEPPPPGESP